jgi:hypothetical protein
MMLEIAPQRFGCQDLSGQWKTQVVELTQRNVRPQIPGARGQLDHVSRSVAVAAMKPVAVAGGIVINLQPRTLAQRTVRRRWQERSRVRQSKQACQLLSPSHMDVERFAKRRRLENHIDVRQNRESWRANAIPLNRLVRDPTGPLEQYFDQGWGSVKSSYRGRIAGTGSFSESKNAAKRLLTNAWARRPRENRRKNRSLGAPAAL